jgi:hypothetical protein
MLTRRLCPLAAALASGGALGLSASQAHAEGTPTGCSPWAVGAAAVSLAAVAASSRQQQPHAEPETLHGRWADGWNAGRYSKAGVGFHRAAANEHLLAHGHLITSGAHPRILVPLCGKTLDLVHLAQTSDHVVGVEGVDRAVNEFFAENPSLGPPRSSASPGGGEFTVTTASRAPCALWLGDFFKLKPSQLGGQLFTGVWDRASMVAIDPALRKHYAQVRLGTPRKPTVSLSWTDRVLVLIASASRRRPSRMYWSPAVRFSSLWWSTRRSKGVGWV